MFERYLFIDSVHVRGGGVKADTDVRLSRIGFPHIERLYGVGVRAASTDAEMIAIADCCTDIQYFRVVLMEMGAPQISPTQVYCDNAGAVRNSRYPTNKRTKTP